MKKFMAKEGNNWTNASPWFETMEEAREWAEKNLKNKEWRIVEEECSNEEAYNNCTN